MGIRREDLKDITLPFKPGELGLPMLIVVLVLWAALGQVVYRVEQDEVGVITTFGEVSSVVGSGLHFKLPRPVQHVQTPRVTEAKRIEVGFRTVDAGPPARYEDPSNSARMREEAEMLTGDENIVRSSLIVQYQIRDAHAYLFNVPDPEGTLHDLTQAVERQVVGDRPIDDVLTVGKSEIQLEVQQRLQALADLYGLGVRIITVQLQDVQPPQEVAAAFKDVATAKEDKSRIENLALGYANEKEPRAKGEAARLILEAEAYRATRIAEAEGDVARFIAVAEEYQKAPEVTRERLYLETMRTVLPRVKKTILDSDAGVINLNDLQAAGGAR